MNEKTYVIYEQIGNFASEVFRSDSFYEIQDYLQERFDEAVNDPESFFDYNDADEQLFYSYFRIEEI